MKRRKLVSLLKSLYCLLILASQISCRPQKPTEPGSREIREILLQKNKPSDSVIFASFRNLSDSASKNRVWTILAVLKSADSSVIKVYKSSNEGKTWQGSLNLGVEKERQAHHEWVNLDGSNLFYLDGASKDSIKKKGKVFFLLVDPLKGASGRLRYTYHVSSGQLKGGFSDTDIDSLKSRLSWLVYLKRRAAGSELLPEEDHKSYLPSSDAALRKWAMLNEGVYEALDDRMSKDLHLNVEEYATDITGDKPAAGTPSENGTYLASIDSLTGAVYVVNRSNKHSFLIWVPANSNTRIERLKLQGQNLELFPRLPDSSVKIYSVEINLLQKTVRKNYSQQPGTKTKLKIPAKHKAAKKTKQRRQ